MTYLSNRKIQKITQALFLESPKDEWKMCKVVIVLGSTKCEYRIQKAAELFQTQDIYYIVCGGNLSAYQDQSGQSLSEAEYMRQYLLKHHIDDVHIIPEADSANTVENLRNAYSLICDRKLSGPIGIVTAGFHMQRVQQSAEVIFENRQLVYIPAYGPNTSKEHWYESKAGRKIIEMEYKKNEVTKDKLQFFKNLKGIIPLTIYDWLSGLYFSCNHSIGTTVKMMPKVFFYTMKCGCAPSEYFILEKWICDSKIRKTLFLKRDNVSFLEQINNQSCIGVLRQKHILLKRMQEKMPDALGRRFIYVPETTKNELYQFLTEIREFVIKPDSLAGGDGIAIGFRKNNRICIIRNKETKVYTVEQAWKLWEGKNLVIEEKIKQHSTVSEVYAGSVNSIRIHTLRIEDQVHIVRKSSMRFGSGGGNIDFDNAIHILVEDGNLVPYGVFCEGGNIRFIEEHPDTHYVFGKVSIPYWNESISLVKQMTLLVPELRFIGWDVAITESGPVIIEGNGAPASYDVEQWYHLKEYGTGIKESNQRILQMTEVI